MIVIIALIISSARGDLNGAPNAHAATESASATRQASPAEAVTVSAPPANPATAAGCTALLEALPPRLGELSPRVVHPTPDSPFVVAWGDPAVILRCGVDRPEELVPTSSSGIYSTNGTEGVYWLQRTDGPNTVWTTIDRSVYIEVTVPTSYSAPPLTPLAQAIAKALPRVCLPQAGIGQTPPPAAQLCTHRK